MQQLTSATLIENILDIRFSLVWDTEDIPSLTTLILNRISALNVIETITGADRQTLRLQYANDNLVLHFDSYSQSCWIEPEYELASDTMTIMKKKLKNA